MGPTANDAVSGVPFPKVLMTPQRGGLVYARHSYGTLDRVEEVDTHHFPDAQPAFPDPVYRVRLLSSGSTALTPSAAARDLLVEDDYVWDLLGYGYPDGDEETGLVAVYELFLTATGDYLYTADLAEVAATMAVLYGSGLTENHRRSAMGTPWAPVYPVADGTINAADRRHAAGYYRDNVMGVITYENRGVAFYGFATGAGRNRVPVYRRVEDGIHTYYSSAAEYFAAPGSLTPEGVIFYLLGGEERTLS